MSDRKGLMALIARNMPNVPSVLADKILDSRWLAEHDRRVAERAWDEAAQAPTGDEREELIGLQLASYSKRMSDGYTSSIIRSNEEAAEIVLDAGFRLPVQGEPTEAQVKAVAKAIRWALPDVNQAQLEVEAHGILAALRAAGHGRTRGDMLPASP